MVITKIKRALESPLAVPVIFAFAFALWLKELNLVCICALVLLVSAILFICDDVKNIYCPIIYAGFFIKDIVVSANWLVYVVCVIAVGASFAAATIKKSRKAGADLKLGRMFFPLVTFDVAFLLGGVIGNFNFTAFAATFGLCLVMLLLYFIAINFTENLDEFLPYLFVCGAAFASLQYCVSDVAAAGSFSGIFKNCGWVTAEGPNTTALFLGLGAAAALGYACRKRYGYLMIFPAVFFVLMIGSICCRGMFLTMAVVLPVECVYVFIKSKQKPQIIATLCTIVAAVLLVDAFSEIVTEMWESFRNKFASNGSSGRLGEGGLWEWCINKFKEYPIFGYGFISKEPVPAIRPQTQYYILAHNTYLQWLTSTGLFGLALSVWFYVEKYAFVAKDLKNSFVISALIVVVALSGVTEQAAAMDPFAFMLPLLLLAAKEYSCQKRKNAVETLKE